jgi:hypothetical protein
MALVSAFSSVVGYVSHWVGKNWTDNAGACCNSWNKTVRIAV